MQAGEETDHRAQEDQDHLDRVAVHHCRHAALQGIQDRDDADDDQRLPERHAGRAFQDDRYGIDHDAGRERPADLKYDAEEDARGQAEASLEEVVDADDAGAVQHRHHEGDEQDHRERHAELVGQPLHAAALAHAHERRRGDEADRGQLRRHRRQRQREPAERAAAEEIALLVGLVPEQVAERQQGGQVQKDDRVVQIVHVNISPLLFLLSPAALPTLCSTP